MGRTVELTEDAARMTEGILEEELSQFVSDATIKAIQEQEAQYERFLAAMYPDYDPRLEPEREHAEFMAIMEEELADPDPIKNSISLEKMYQRMDETLAAIKEGKKP